MSSVSGGAIGKKRKKPSKKQRFDADFVRRIVPHASEGSAKLRACFKCKLVKTEEQWEENGCMNCRWDGTAFSFSLYAPSPAPLSPPPPPPSLALTLKLGREQRQTSWTRPLRNSVG